MATEQRIAWIGGATGYTGSSLVPVLVKRGWTVHAHVRPDSTERETWTRRFREMGAEVDTTPWDAAAMELRLKELQPTAVFSLLGTTKKRGRAGDSGAIEDTYEAVDYGLTSLLLRATADGAPSARFIYLSAWGVKPDTKSPYMRARARVEKELAQSDLDFVIIRPAVIGGDRPETRTLESVGGTIANGFASVLHAVGAKRAAADLRTRTGHELAVNCADAAEHAMTRSALTGFGLDNMPGAGVV